MDKDQVNTLVNIIITVLVFIVIGCIAYNENQKVKACKQDPVCYEKMKAEEEAKRERRRPSDDGGIRFGPGINTRGQFGFGVGAGSLNF